MGQLKEELTLNTSQFDSNINSVIKKVEELKNKGSKVGDGFNSSMGKMIERVTGFNGSMGSLISVVGKFSGALGLAMGASEAFNKVIHSSQTLTDEFGAIQQGVTTVVDNFFQSLASGDFSPFLNGMDNITSKAREAYNIMDALWNMAQSFSVQNARLNNQFQQNLNEIRAKKDSKDPNDKKRVKELTEENKRIIEQQAKGGVKLYNQTISGLQSEIAASTGMNSKITEGAIYRIVENDINNLKSGRAKYKREYESYQKELDKLNKKADKDFQNGGMGRYGVNYTNEKNALERKYGEAIAANYLLNRKNDKEFEEFNNKLKQGIQYQGVAIANQSKMLRYTKETNNAASGGRGGKTTNGGNTHTYAVGSIGYYEKLISNLQKEIKLQVDPSEIIKLQNELKEAKNLKDRLENADFVKRQDEVKNNTQLSGLGSLFGDTDDKKIKERIKNTKEEIKNFNPVIKSIPEQFSDAVDKMGVILDAYDMGAIGADKAKQLIDGINEQLLALGLKPIQVPIEIDKSLQKVNAMKDAFASLESVMSSMGQMFEEPLLDATGMIAAAVANYILGWTEATKKASLLGPIGWAAFGLSTAAQMFAVVAQIKAAGAFANGGVIGGSQYAGDALLARVNSGEMILNGSQQAALFDLIDKGNSNGVTGNVNFVIRGKDLHGVLYNYDSKMKKVI